MINMGSEGEEDSSFIDTGSQEAENDSLDETGSEEGEKNPNWQWEAQDALQEALHWEMEPRAEQFRYDVHGSPLARCSSLSVIEWNFIGWQTATKSQLDRRGTRRLLRLPTRWLWNTLTLSGICSVIWQDLITNGK